MPENLKFYPEQKSVTINPMDKKGELRYFLEGFSGEIGQNAITLKYAFPAKLGTDSPHLKEKVRNILVDVLDISKFSVTSVPGKATILVPIRRVSDPTLLPREGTIRIPILVKLVKAAQKDQEEMELKCSQEINLITDVTEEQLEQAAQEKGQDDTPAQDVPEPQDVEFQDDKSKAGKGAKPDVKDAKDAKDAKAKKAQPEEEPADDTAEKQDEGDADSDSDSEEKGEDKADKEKEEGAGAYSGLLAIDYGTTNSAIVVRDPRYAAEEVRGQLSSEQWDSLCTWLEDWLANHLSQMQPNETDLFVENLTKIVPNADLPTCGTPPDDIKRSLMKLDDNIRQQILTETLCRLSNFSQEGTNSKILKEIAPEVMLGFESVIDSKSLESQRYFVLELDENAGPAPIPSTLQIVSAPQTEDLTVLMEETKVDMGARVGLLLRSAASGGADIRQFVLSVKRYFGRDEVIEVVPAENGNPIQFPADVLVRLAYRELLNRAVADIHRRAEAGQFQDAEWPCSVVSTFPTSYPASLRRNLREIMTDLNIKEIDTRFDEATAAAIYYIWREVGADPVCGMNGLMARCRKDRHSRSYQNILLYDLGGGTTDIALIQLIYEELAIFEEEEDRGNGGRYFRITPRLLGTTGHRYLGGDLITLWLFRLVKSKLADSLLNLITAKNIEAPVDSPLGQVLLNLPESLIESGADESAPPRYRNGALLDWTSHPLQQMRQYNKLNETIIDLLVPTRFVNDQSKTSNFFTLWEIVEELKKSLGTPVETDIGSGLATDWPEETEIDSGQMFNFVQNCHPWLTDSGAIQQDDLRLSVTQQDLVKIAREPIKQSLSLAVSLSKARLLTQDYRDRIDRLILSGMSCNMKCVQQVANEVFMESEGIFDYDPANVRFDRDSAKTAVALGACIGRYLESVRIDPYNEKTKQMLRDGYDQVELVIENLFTYLSCRLAYDSLVAMVTIFDQGHELNLRSYTDRRPVARTSIHNLRPVQEKFWIYRIDFEGAEPQYLGLINAESVANEHGFEDFRKFREQYLVGFEADAELFVRAFFLPRGRKTIVAKTYQEPSEGEAFPELIAVDEGKAAKDKAKAQNKDKAKPQDKAKAQDKNKPESTEEEEEGYMPPDDEAEDSVDFNENEEGNENPDVNEDEAAEGDEAETEEKSVDAKAGKDAKDAKGKDGKDAKGKDAKDGKDAKGKDAKDGKDAKGKDVKDGKGKDAKDVNPDETEEPQEEEPQGPPLALTHTITSQELFDRRPVFQAGTPLEYIVEYPDGSHYRCAISEPLPIRTNYEFHIEKPSENAPYDPTQETDPQLVNKFHLNEEEIDEATLIVDERGHLIMLTSSPYDIQIWADIEYVPQKMDIHYDPFCGHH